MRGKTGTPMNVVVYGRKAVKRIQRARARQENRWASLCGDVTTRTMTDEERERYLR